VKHGLAIHATDVASNNLFCMALPGKMYFQRNHPIATACLSMA